MLLLSALILVVQTYDKPHVLLKWEMVAYGIQRLSLLLYIQCATLRIGVIRIEEGSYSILLDPLACDGELVNW